MDSEFKRRFKALKALRNSHQIDEHEFEDEVEQLAADLYAHPTEDGWCCACDADIAFLQAEIERAVREARIDELVRLKTRMSYANVSDTAYQLVDKDEVDERIAELEQEAA